MFLDWIPPLSFVTYASASANKFNERDLVLAHLVHLLNKLGLYRFPFLHRLYQERHLKPSISISEATTVATFPPGSTAIHLSHIGEIAGKMNIHWTTLPWSIFIHGIQVCIGMCYALFNVLYFGVYTLV